MQLTSRCNCFFELSLLFLCPFVQPQSNKSLAQHKSSSQTQPLSLSNLNERDGKLVYKICPNAIIYQRYVFVVVTLAPLCY